MILKEKIMKLAEVKQGPCVSISLNTHRVLPDNLKDVITLKNLVAETKKALLCEYNKKEISNLLNNLDSLVTTIDVHYNLDSLHLFVSNEIKEAISIPWPIHEDSFQLGNTFNLRSIIKASNRSEEYLILLLSQGGAQLFHAINDGVVEELTSGGFPFPPNPHYIEDREARSDAKRMDHQVLEYFNTIDKAIRKIVLSSELPCIVISTKDNYSKLIQVADDPGIYSGHTPIDYNRKEKHHIAEQAWKIIKELQYTKRSEAIAEMKEAVNLGNVVTDIQEIYRAAIEGRGDMLIVREDVSLKGKILKDNILDISEISGSSDMPEDLVSDIALEIISKKGRVFFTCQKEIQDLGDIVLKTRY